MEQIVELLEKINEYIGDKYNDFDIIKKENIALKKQNGNLMHANRQLKINNYELKIENKNLINQCYFIKK